MSPSVTGFPDLLAAIVASTRRRVEARAERVDRSELEKTASSASQIRSFKNAISRPDRINVIAECKRRSPSRGVLRADYDPVAIAQTYDRNGAAAISVLTEPSFFDGSIDHLKAIRNATSLPLLRKDFIVDSYQIIEARAAGADAVLLIVAALPPDDLVRLHREARAAGMDVLVEVHAVHELPIAIDAGADIIGVNNRNLSTLSVNLEVSDQFMSLMSAGVVAVAESGIRTADDIRRFRDGGYRAFLIGERFMTSDDPGRELADLLGAAEGLLQR